MKASLLIILTILSIASRTVAAGTVTMVINNDPARGNVVLSNSVSVASNEVAVIKSVGPERLGDYGPAQDCRCDLLVGGTTITYYYLNYAVGQRIAGPSEIRFYTPQAQQPGGTASGFLTIEVQPETFPPDKTIILPIGTVGVVHVESSTNLVSWQDEWVNTFSNTNQNRFFRLRAERSLP